MIGHIMEIVTVTNREREEKRGEVIRGHARESLTTSDRPMQGNAD